MAGALGALLLALPGEAARAQDTNLGPNAHHEAARIVAAELAMTQATALLQQLSAERPSTVTDGIRHRLAVEAALYQFRVAARLEELRVNELAGYADVEASVIALIPQDLRGPVAATIEGLHSIYILAGIDQYYLVNVHFLHPYGDAAPLSSLRAYYLEAQQKYGVDASYLAAINYIESNFGRVNGPSSAGALGPMQFLPSTWAEYGQGGNVMNPLDAILGAARYLAANGAPSNMANAIYHYNPDYDYVAAVEDFARAYRADPGWLDRMYYWNTIG